MLTCGQTRSYRVRATNAGGDSAYSNVASGSTPICSPAAPSGLSATARVAAGGVLSVDLSWTDNRDNESGFEIQRTGGTGGAVTLTRAASNTNATTCTDSTAVCGQTYTYAVRSIHAGGNSVYTGTGSATTRPCGNYFIATLGSSTAKSGNATTGT